MKDLKVLEMEGSRLSILWSHQSQSVPMDLRELNICAPLSEIPKSIGQLKSLERIVISHEREVPMKKLPDEFCRLGSLKYLVLRKFSEMVLLPDSFGELTNLQHINLDRASSLQTLPDSFGKLTRLKHLSLSQCSSLTIASGTLGDITTLEYLDLSHCKHVNELPPQVAHQLSLQTLYMSGTKLKELPRVGCNLKHLVCGGDLLETLLPGLPELKSLKRLSVEHSPRLKSLAESNGLLTQLTELYIENCGIEYLPRWLLKMNLLETLKVSECPLREHPFKEEVEGERETEGETALNKLNPSNDRCMFGLQSLNLSETEIREVYFDDCVCPNLQDLSFFGCSELRQIRGLCNLPKLRYLDIDCCAKVEELSGLETLTSLVTLSVWGCVKLESISGLEQLTKLRELEVTCCREIQELPGMEHLAILERLNVGCCEKLQSIPGLGQLTKLRELEVTSCREIQALPVVEHLTSLETLSVGDCEKLQSIPRLGKLTKLIKLQVSECHEIQVLPSVEHLTSLCELNVSGLQKLKSIPGLGQLTELIHLDVSKCCELQELSGVEYLMSLEVINARECPKLRWRKGVHEQLCQRLKDDFTYDKQKTGCNCLEFLQFPWS